MPSVKGLVLNFGCLLNDAVVSIVGAEAIASKELSIANAAEAVAPFDS